MRVFEKTANMGRMIIEMTKDMYAFLIFMFIVIFAMAHWTYIFLDTKLQMPITGENFFTAFMKSYL